MYETTIKGAVYLLTLVFLKEQAHKQVVGVAVVIGVGEVVKVGVVMHF